MRRDEMQMLDRKFKIKAVSNKSGKLYTHENAILFLGKDKLLPDLLDAYIELCSKYGVDKAQLLGVQLLKDRVMSYQRANIKKVHLPDVAEGEEEKRVCKLNR
jgi:hypothetical protein